MAENKEKLVQLKDRDLQTLLYPKITGGSIPKEGITKDKIADGVLPVNISELKNDVPYTGLKMLLSYSLKLLFKGMPVLDESTGNTIKTTDDGTDVTVTIIGDKITLMEDDTYGNMYAYRIDAIESGLYDWSFSDNNNFVIIVSTSNLVTEKQDLASTDVYKFFLQKISDVARSYVYGEYFYILVITDSQMPDKVPDDSKTITVKKHDFIITTDLTDVNSKISDVDSRLSNLTIYESQLGDNAVTKAKLSTDLQTELAGDLTFSVVKEL